MQHHMRVLNLHCINGKQHNLIVMVNDVSELWKKMEDLLLDYDIKTQW